MRMYCPQYSTYIIILRTVCVIQSCVDVVEEEHTSQVAVSQLYPPLPQQVSNNALSYISLQPSVVRLLFFPRGAMLPVSLIGIYCCESFPVCYLDSRPFTSSF